MDRLARTPWGRAQLQEAYAQADKRWRELCAACALARGVSEDILAELTADAENDLLVGRELLEAIDY